MQLHRHFTDFIEKQGAAIGLFELPGTIPHGTGKSTPYVTKELAFQKSRRNGCTVNGYKRLFTTGPSLVNRPCNEFFSGSTFSSDQDARLGRSNPSNNIKDILHDIGDTNHVTEINLMRQFIAQPLVFFLQTK